MDTSSEKKPLDKNNPVRDALRGAPKRTVSDIVPRLRQSSGGQARLSVLASHAGEQPDVAPAPQPKAVKRPILPRPTPPPEETVLPVPPRPPVHAPVAAAPFFTHKPEHVAPRPEEPRREALRHPRSPRRGLLVWSGIVVVLAGTGAFLVFSVLPRATITLNLKETSVNFADQVRVDSVASNVLVESGRIVLPGELLTARKNVELSFPASGVKQVQTKAAGKLTIWNAYSSKGQPLVAGTRVVSPDGKLFKLNQAVLVPGAKIEGGKIAPSSSTEAMVTADASGAEFNIPPAKNWRFPAFKGKPQYDGFYGESVAAMSGGFVGEQALPTGGDLAAARAKVSQTLQDALQSQLLVALADTFTVLEGTRQFKVVREEVRTGGADSKVFSIFEEAELRELAFVESMLRDAIFERAARAIQYPTAAQDFKLAYDPPKV